jgi:uncharacterized membrane protein YheB (UPF0754 family)
MRRDNPLTTYVSDETKAEIEQRARDEDETVSTYLDRLIRRQLATEAQEDIASEARAEERIREVAAVAVDEIQQTTERMRDDLQRTLEQVDAETTEDNVETERRSLDERLDRDTTSAESDAEADDDDRNIFDELRGND